MIRRSVSCLFILVSLVSAGLCFAKEYTVKEGDTILTVLGRFAPSEADLKEANPQKRDWPNLHVGERLEIPYLTSAEVHALEVQRKTIQNDLSIAEESIVALTGARDLARSESSAWQGKFEAADPIAKSAEVFQKSFWGATIVFSIILIVFVVYIWALMGNLRVEREAKERFRQDVDRQKQEIIALQRASLAQPPALRATANSKPALAAVYPRK